MEAMACEPVIYFEQAAVHGPQAVLGLAFPGRRGRDAGCDSRVDGRPQRRERSGRKVEPMWSSTMRGRWSGRNTNEYLKV